MGTMEMPEKSLNAEKRRRTSPKTLTEQLQYYFSKENLATDKFFHKVISENEGKGIPLTNLLQCRRVQDLGISDKASFMEQLGDDNESFELNDNEICVAKFEVIVPELISHPP